MTQAVQLTQFVQPCFAALATLKSHGRPAQLKQSVQLCFTAPVTYEHRDKSAEGVFYLYRSHSKLHLLLSAAETDMQVLGT